VDLVHAVGILTIVIMTGRYLGLELIDLGYDAVKLIQRRRQENDSNR
jgi:hypothetical protein